MRFGKRIADHANALPSIVSALAMAKCGSSEESPSVMRLQRICVEHVQGVWLAEIVEAFT